MIGEVSTSTELSNVSSGDPMWMQIKSTKTNVMMKMLAVGDLKNHYLTLNQVRIIIMLCLAWYNYYDDYVDLRM